MAQQVHRVVHSINTTMENEQYCTAVSQAFDKKPHKWGYKVFVLSGISGFCYDDFTLELRTCNHINQNYKVFFDNWFASVPLLSNEGFLSLGTVRKNRVPDFVFPK